MRHFGLGLLLAVLVVCSNGIPAWAVNSVVVQSDTVAVGGADTITVKFTNDLSLVTVVLPLAVRQITPGSYITALKGDRNPKDRLTLSKDAEESPLGSLVGFSIVNRFNKPDGNCKETLPGGFKTTVPSVYTGPWGVDSAAILFVCGQLDPADPSDPTLSPGADTAGGSLRLIFTVNSTQGTFEIDTTCTDPANHFVWVHGSGPDSLVPASFTKGTIQIGSGSAVQYLGGDGVPRDYSLDQNYPNPFNASTVIRFNIKHDGHVRLDVFNILGQKVKTLVDEFRSYGPQAADWDGSDMAGRAVPTGLYFYRLATNDYADVKKMLLIK